MWLNDETGREALIKFTYKDSARRVLASYSHNEAFSDMRCEIATAEIINAFLASDTNIVLKEYR